MKAIIHDERRRKWWRFAYPRRHIQATTYDEVLPALAEIEAATQHGAHAVGFIAYEAAPAFDRALQTHSPNGFPLLVFGIFDAPEPIEIPHQVNESYHTGEWHPDMSLEAYQHAIARIKEAIAQGDTYQVNFTMRLRTSFQGSPWAFFVDLFHAQEAPLAAYLEHGEMVICSVSPELFFAVDGERIWSRPMKGTAARAPIPHDDRLRANWLRHSNKNRAENVMIVDMIRNDLARIAQLGSVEVPRLFDVERYPTVWQMTSTVEARTDASLPAILQALFPCASITGAPKASTMRIIASLETSPRHLYTGTIGWIAPGRQMQFNVAIRTVVIDRQTGTAEYGVGGGIVWDSHADDEYAECQAKARVLTERRPHFDLLETMLWTPKAGFFLWKEHLERLRLSADYFDFAFDIRHLLVEADTIVRTFAPTPQRVRLRLSRNGETHWEHVPLANAPYPNRVRLALAPHPVSSDNVFLSHKTTHRAIYEAARAACPTADDVLLWNEQGHITETTTANIVAWLDGRLITPPVRDGLLNGTLRRWLLQHGIIEEAPLPLEALPACQKLYVINSVRGWRPAYLVNETAHAHNPPCTSTTAPLT
nr:aminodeoxychorismate synthase component I [Ardenticatena sp.]